MELKQLIPNEEVLKEVIAKNISIITAEIREEVGPLEEEYKKHKKRRNGAILHLATAVVFFLLIMEIISTSITIFEIVIIFICVVFASIFTISSSRLFRSGEALISDFHTKVNTILFSKALNILNIQGSIIGISTVELEMKEDWKKLIYGSLHSSMRSVQSLDIINNLRLSELRNDSGYYVNVYSSYELTHQGRKISGGEIAILKSKSNDPTHFEGHFVYFDLGRTLKGKTFITYESKLGSVWAAKDVPEITLEWSQFENKVQVLSSDEVEARYILSPDFMSDLYDWMNKNTHGARISFIGNKVYIMYSADGTHFKNTIGSITDEKVGNYLFGIAKPFLHVFHLIEDVR